MTIYFNSKQFDPTTFASCNVPSDEASTNAILESLLGMMLF